MTKLLIIGIDGMDSLLLSRFEDDLPNLRRFRAESPDVKLKSVYPPDSPTAWTSIYTGLNPARTGVVSFVDPVEKITIRAAEDVDARILQGNTFWDIAGKQGRKVCIVLPLFAYPSWTVNGVMVNRTSQRNNKKYSIQTYPSELAERYEVSHLDFTQGYYPVNIGDWVKLCEKVAQDEAELGLNILRDYECDLFFISSGMLDLICHPFWRYLDESDPTYPGNNRYKNVIKEFYQLYDEIIGKFIAAAGSDAMVMVISDHGHGMRPPKLVNVNEILKKKGFLVPKVKKASYHAPYYLVEKLRGSFAQFASKHRSVANAAQKLLHLFPGARKIYTSPIAIDWDKTVAYVSDLSGIKAYTYGGVIIKREGWEGSKYEELRSQLIEELYEMREPGSGDRLMKWICRREELYTGDYITRYPDLVFEFQDRFGVGWAVDGSIISDCQAHHIQPGTHKIDSPVFLVSNMGDRQIARKDMTLMDIAPTVLHLLGVEGDFDFDGKSIVT